LLGGGDRLLDALNKLNEAFCHIYLTVSLIAINDQIELSKLDSGSKYFPAVENVNQKFGVSSWELLSEDSVVETVIEI
jgi:hypothetical protein